MIAMLCCPQRINITWIETSFTSPFYMAWRNVFLCGEHVFFSLLLSLVRSFLLIRHHHRLTISFCCCCCCCSWFAISNWLQYASTLFSDASHSPNVCIHADALVFRMHHSYSSALLSVLPLAGCCLTCSCHDYWLHACSSVNGQKIKA